MSLGMSGNTVRLDEYGATFWSPAIEAQIGKLEAIEPLRILKVVGYVFAVGDLGAGHVELLKLPESQASVFKSVKDAVASPLQATLRDEFTLGFGAARDHPGAAQHVSKYFLGNDALLLFGILLALGRVGSELCGILPSQIHQRGVVGAPRRAAPRSGDDSENEC